MALKAEIKTDYPGIVPVRAKESREGLLREKSACGFFGVKRYPGDVFYLNKPEEYSPRWMEIVEPDKLPEGWKEIIDMREKQRAMRLQEKALLESKSPAMMQQELMQMAILQTVQTLIGAQGLTAKNSIPSSDVEFSSGEMKRRGRPPKLDLSGE